MFKDLDCDAFRYEGYLEWFLMNLTEDGKKVSLQN